MDLRTLLRIMWRRWYAVGAVVLLTVAAAGLVLQSIEPTYRAEGSVLLLGPSDRVIGGTADGGEGDGEGAELERQNPYIEFDRSLETTAVVIARSLTEGEVADAIRESGYSEEFEVEVSEDGPLLEMSATDAVSSRALETVGALFDAIDEELRLRQEAVDAPEFLRIRSQVLNAPRRATELTVIRDRALAAIFLLGLGVAVGVALAVERWADRGAARERAAAPRRRDDEHGDTRRSRREPEEQWVRAAR